LFLGAFERKSCNTWCHNPEYYKREDIIIILIIIIKYTKIQEFMERDKTNMWNMKCMIIPVTTGAIGMVTKVLKKNLEAITGKHSTDSLQKRAILGISHIIWKVPQSEIGSLSGGDHRWFKRRSTGEKTWFVSGM
jgi:hypothetical protein